MLFTRFIRSRSMFPSGPTNPRTIEGKNRIEQMFIKRKAGTLPTPEGIGRNVQTPGIYNMRLDGFGGSREPAKFWTSRPGEKTSGNPGILYTFTVLDGAFANTPYSAFDRIDMEDESKNWFALQNLDAYTQGLDIATVEDGLEYLCKYQPTYRIELQSNEKNGVRYLNPIVLGVIEDTGSSVVFSAKEREQTNTGTALVSADIPV